MRVKFSRNKNRVKNLFYVMGIILVLILIFAIILLKKFNNKITPNLLSIAQASINKLNESILMQYRVSEVYEKVNLDDVIKITKNDKDEIIAIDFVLENAYDALSVITNYLQNRLEDEDTRHEILKYYSEDLSSSFDSIILTIPIGVASKDIYLANLGPRIPVKVNYMGYLATSVRIKVEDYGINNALISLYIDCSITNEFIVPRIQKEINHSYSVLIASKIIQGVVPEYYGGVMETKSNILNVPIE